MNNYISLKKNNIYSINIQMYDESHIVSNMQMSDEAHKVIVATWNFGHYEDTKLIEFLNKIKNNNEANADLIIIGFQELQYMNLWEGTKILNDNMEVLFPSYILDDNSVNKYALNQYFRIKTFILKKINGKVSNFTHSTFNYDAKKAKGALIYKFEYNKEIYLISNCHAPFKTIQKSKDFFINLQDHIIDKFKGVRDKDKIILFGDLNARSLITYVDTDGAFKPSDLPECTGESCLKLENKNFLNRKSIDYTIEEQVYDKEIFPDFKIDNNDTKYSNKTFFDSLKRDFDIEKKILEDLNFGNSI